MLRHYTMQVLGQINKTDGSAVTDAAIVDWVNNKVGTYVYQTFILIESSWFLGTMSVFSI